MHGGTRRGSSLQIGAVQRCEKIALIVCHKRDVCFWTYEGESAANKEKKSYIPIRSYIAASTGKTLCLRDIYTKIVIIQYFACHPCKFKQSLSVMYACSGQCASTCSISPLTSSLLSFRIIKSLFSFIIVSGEFLLMSKRTL
ncbi:hypothetical protein C5S32_01245 [ANME-1 cluster archaeon GoMg1]|nr:hypothetical protein [ANME-1 cluster archaeon GoMg1]